MRTLTLSFPHFKRDGTDVVEDAYRVEQVVGSTDYKPGELLERAQVKDLCELGVFKVIMNRNNERQK
jgi:hypothetical protein